MDLKNKSKMILFKKVTPRFILSVQQYFLVIIIVTFITSCNSDKKIPNVSNIKIDITTERFEKDFFSMDTTDIDNSIQHLYEKYPTFTIDYFHNILAAAPQADSIIKTIKHFRADYNQIYIDAEKQFDNFSSLENEIKQGFQFVKYYFPDYKLPHKLITYIGTWDAMIMLSNNSGGSGCIRISEDAMGIGLQLSMGTNYPMYKDEIMQQFYPYFISRKFDKAYISTNVLKVIIDDLYPHKNTGSSLIEQMIDAGKRLYLLDAFLPYTADTLKTGYTEQQLKGCYENEATIWSYFVTNNLLYQTEASIIMEFLNDGPKTAALGDGSPGFIGQFTGWQIVKQWMKKNKEKTLSDLLKTPSKTIFEQAKYKP